METAGASVTVKETALKPRVDERRCSGCGRCVAACREKVFTLDSFVNRKKAVLLDGKACSLCGKCVEECPLGAVVI